MFYFLSIYQSNVIYFFFMSFSFCGVEKMSSLMSEMTVESPESLSSLCHEPDMDSETKALLDLALGVSNDTNNHLLAMMADFALIQGMCYSL